MSQNFRQPQAPQVYFQETQKTEYDGAVTIIIDMFLGEEQLGWAECRFKTDTFQNWTSRWHIGHIEVRKESREQGYGEQLLKRTCQNLWLKQVVPITVDPVSQDPTVSNEVLRQFSLKAGFKETEPGTRMRRYPD